MNDSPNTLAGAADIAAPSAPADERAGWYLYGITRAEQGTRDDLSALLQVDGDAQAGTNEPVEAIASSDLQAVVRRVSLDDFSPEALSAQAEDPAWIESVARRHHAVIEAVHRTRPILPAKFGSVYACVADVQTALRDEHDVLLARLNKLDGCDEWGVRLYGDGATIRQRAEEEQESVRRLRQDLASASPGRAFFLQRKLEDELAHAVDYLLDDLVQRAYVRFARHARAGQVSWQINGSHIPPEGESAEVLRAAFLVPRASAEAFIEDVHRFPESQPGFWCDYSGPWPPYSFAAQTEQSEQGE